MESMERLFDPFGLLSSFWKVQEGWMQKPVELADALTKLSSDVQCRSTEELIPLVFESYTAKGASDDPQALLLNMVKGYSKLAHKVHATCSTWLRDYVNNAEGLEGIERQRSMFWTNQFINSLSPTNFFWTNPAAVQKCIRTRGESLINGLKNFREDAERGDNLIKIADMEAFKVGENLATTPGYVVFRNELIELIQYTPTTETTHTIPVVFVQPSINKFYILDMTEDKSLVRYLTNQGFTVFMVSWKNPTSDMRNITFDDYMFRGALKAIEVAKDICGVEQVHAVGFCIGGTVLAALMAWLNRSATEGQILPVKHWTLFATMVDYSEPGDLGAFVSEHAIEEVECLMEKDGYLDGKYMAMAFRLLRSDSLVWRYFAHNYLQGEMPPKSDFLYWNSESTRLPAAMGSFYLREFYLQNNLIKEDGIVLGGLPTNLRLISQPLYAVGAEQDHICPWKGTYKICNLVKGPVRYALAEEGHIAGVVNPPSVRGRKSFWASDVKPDMGPEEWLTGQQKQQGSWWVDWVNWLSERCDATGPPPPMGNEKYPPLEKAPGTYVMEK